MVKLKRYLLAAFITLAVGLLVFITLIVVANINNSSEKHQIEVKKEEQQEKQQEEQENQEREELINKREEYRNAYLILDAAPDELANRVNDTYEGGSSIEKYLGASEPVKVASSEQEFKEYCEQLFFDNTEPIEYSRWMGEVYKAVCGVFEIYRTELFNPEYLSGRLQYEKPAGMEDMVCSYEFFYDCTGKYAMLYSGFNESEKCVAAKFIGLQFGEEYPYIAPNASEIERLGSRTQSMYSGKIEDYYEKKVVVRVKSNEDEFVEYCENLFDDFDNQVVYEKDSNNEIISAYCGDDYSVYRTQYFEPVYFDGELRVEGMTIGDTVPPHYNFAYDSSGKYALVFNSFSDPEGLGEKFLGFTRE